MHVKKVLIGMSGGVDSSVAALLLKQQGYEVIGVTLNLWEKKNDDSAISDAKKVCDKLGIEHHVLDFRGAFQEKVIDYFAREYIEGRTPNPCIACNKYIKFEILLSKAQNIFECDYIATGHYAKVDFDNNTNRYFLRMSKAVKKDQTYFLYNLTQEQLAHTLMPLGDYEKDEIREIAEKNGLINAKRRDSQEICFVENNDYVSFISNKYNYVAKKGYFVDINGNKLGEHKGIINYTIGQRKGLGLSLGKYQYVIKLDKYRNEVVIGDEEYLFSDTLFCTELNFMSIGELTGEMQVTAKIRYAAKPVEATIVVADKSRVKVVFKEKQRAITPGQAVVFYDDDIVIGGGIIQ